jgi:alkanesulfonate monooxygenase SsuD/methylene tetrahydromethanopterin reductase-like flavin-dependent oxidoreductase (luciferase family)
MKLGIGLPNTMATEVDGSLMLDWARLADEAGFEVLGTIDKPNYDSWDPLTTLAGVAGVTVQDPGPPIWIGAGQPKAVERAARIGDGFLFGTAGPQVMAERAPAIREQFAANGKPDVEIAGLAHVGVGDDAQAALDEAAHHVVRYYGHLWTEPSNLIHHGSAAKIADEVAAYADAIDVLILFPEIPRLDQVAQLAEHVLPAHG